MKLNNEQKILSICAKVPAKTEDLLPSHFTNELNKNIFKLIKDMFENDEFVSFDTLKNRLRTQADYIQFLIEQDIDIRTFDDLVSYQKNFVFERKIAKTVNELSKMSSDKTTSIDEKQAKLSSMLEENSNNTDFTSNEIVSMETGLKDFISNLSKNKKRGFTTGNLKLDYLCPTFNTGGSVNYTGARSKMGKTVQAQSYAKGAALDDRKVLFISSEMPTEDIIARFVSDIAEVDQTKIHSRDLSQDEIERIQNASSETISKIKNNIYFIDRVIAVEELKSIYRNAKRKMGRVDMIVIDYLQLLTTFEKFNGETERVSHISQYIKKTAKDLNIPINVLVQLNRNLEMRENKRPIESDLKSSGSIEQDASVIVMLYRDEVYDENSDIKGYTEIIVRKNRNGKEGTIIMKSELQYSRFTETSEEEEKEVKQKIYNILTKKKK